MGIKEKWIELKKKACDFYNEHKTGVKTAAIGIGAFALGSFATYRMLHSDAESVDVPELDYDAAIANEVDEGNPYRWNEEEYRETYDRVREFADTLNLKCGESYIIDDCKQYYDDDWYKGRTDDKPIVSHMLNGVGIYPDEES